MVQCDSQCGAGLGPGPLDRLGAGPVRGLESLLAWDACREGRGQWLPRTHAGLRDAPPAAAPAASTTPPMEVPWPR